MKHLNRRAPWSLALLAVGFFSVMPARAADPPMSGMKMSGGASEDPEMRAMMAAPLPFGIMIGRAERWMVGRSYMAHVSWQWEF
jgi:hypothetical protein